MACMEAEWQVQDEATPGAQRPEPSAQRAKRRSPGPARKEAEPRVQDKAKEGAQSPARKEAERQAQEEEAARKANTEAERPAREDAEGQAQEEAAHMVKAEAESLAPVEEQQTKDGAALKKQEEAWSLACKNVSCPTPPGSPAAAQVPDLATAASPSSSVKAQDQGQQQSGGQPRNSKLRPGGCVFIPGGVQRFFF